MMLLRNGVCALVVGVLCVAAFRAPAAGATARGTVFEDRDGDGRRDPSEPGVAGVAVSNERDVVLTDEDGRYEMEVAARAIIFVTKPAGYAVPLSAQNLPRFYYIHRPDGEPGLHYPGVEATGPLPEAIDFPLTRIEERKRFEIVAFADPQPQTKQEVLYLQEDVLGELVRKPYAFGVCLGDIMFDDLSLFPLYNDSIARLGFPFYNVAGNHDINFDAASDAESTATFVRFFGPANYSWSVGDVHFVAMDNILYKGRGYDGRPYHEGFDEASLEWLRNDLARVPPRKLLVLCTHAPIRFSLDEEHRLCLRAEGLFEVLRDRREILALSGHTHLTFQHRFTAADGWNGGGEFRQVNCVTASGAWWSGPPDDRGVPAALQYDGTPNGYTIVSFDGAAYQVRYKAAGYAPGLQMHIFPPGRHENGPAPERTVLANVFYGTPDSRVAFRLDDGPFLPMERTPQRDPLAIRHYGDSSRQGKDWIRPRLTEHIWQAMLPEKLPPGTHAITVQAEVGGRTVQDAVVFLAGQ